jgi:hypothetical protein
MQLALGSSITAIIVKVTDMTRNPENTLEKIPKNYDKSIPRRGEMQ